MSDWITLEGLKPWDGRYPLNIDLEPFTTREWGWIKRLSGYLPENISVGDPELICVLAVIALHRSGKIASADVPDTFDRIVDAPFGPSIRLESDEQEAEAEAEAVPPPSAVGNGANGSSSGSDSALRSETLQAAQKGFGTAGSATSVSAPPTSVT